MEFRLYFQILRRGWWIITLTILVALVIALGASYLVAPRYRAVVRFIVTPGTDLADRYQVLTSLNTLDNQVITLTYAEVMNSDRIYAEALSFLQLQPTDLEEYTYEAVVVSGTSVLELTVSGPNPQMVASLANAIGYRTINFVRQLNQVYNFDFLDIPVPPDEPYSPNPLLNGGLAIVLGLIGGIVLTVLNEQLRIPFETLRQRLHFDAITGVFTSKYFSHIIDDELTQHPDGVLTIGIVELNGLRDLVEALPIVSLQRILRKVTEILRRELRGNDVIGRWNEYSFIIMLPNTHGIAARGIFDRIFQALAHPFEIEQLDMTVEFDPLIGGAQYGNNISAEELLEKAGIALERSRRDNSESVYVWDIKSPFWTEPVVDKNV
jgi:capsular polysaccharide biosynthesis protein